MSETTVTLEAPVAVAIPKIKAAPKVKAAPKKAATPAPAKPTPKKAGERGSAVGYLAKTKEDCSWNETRVAFYNALRKIGGEGTAEEIAKASKGSVSKGNCLNYGYRGVAAGMNKLESREDTRGFVFKLTAKGKTVNLDKFLV